jgi:signal peptidase
MAPPTGAVRPDAFHQAMRLVKFALLATAGAVLALVATATVPVLFGYHTYILEGSSMEPTLKLGSVAVTKPVAVNALEVGDIIAYRARPDTTPVLHRIIEVTEVEGRRAFITQGDKNATPDAEPVILAGEGDRVVYSVPYAGYILEFAQSWLGRALLLGLPVLGFAANALRQRLRGAPAAAASQAQPIAAPSLAPAAIPAVQRLPVLLTQVPSFQVLMDASRALCLLPAVEDASVLDYRDGRALFELRLRAAVTPQAIAQQLRAVTGLAVVREAAPGVRLRVLAAPDKTAARSAA